MIEVINLTDISLIDECPMDHCVKYVERSDEYKYIVLEKDYFTFNVGNIKNIKCDYGCRNYIMYELNKYHNEIFYKNMIECEFDGDLELINGVFYNTKLPYMVFTNEKVDDINVIIHKYDNINMDLMVEIVQQKRCHQEFFIVYLENKKCMSYNIKTKHINYFEAWMIDEIIETLYEHPDVMIEIEDAPPPQLRIVEENKKYHMKMTEDVFSIYEDRLIASRERYDFIVEFILKSGKAFIVHDNKYLSKDGTFVSEIPEEGFDIYDDRVGFKDKMMDIEWYTGSYGEIVFNRGPGVLVYFDLYV
jgi:hypothetical protein